MKNMGTFFLNRQTIFLFFLTLTILFCAYVGVVIYGYPVITLDFDAHEQGENLILEAEYADGSKMPFAEAERILKEGGKCEIILSEDDCTDRSDYSYGGHRKWSFFSQ